MEMLAHSWINALMVFVWKAELHVLQLINVTLLEFVIQQLVNTPIQIEQIILFVHSSQLVVSLLGQCSSGTYQPAGFIPCNSPPSQCFFSNGTCDVTSGSCSYIQMSTGTSCNDVNPCTLNDTCSSTGVYSGTYVICSASDQCHVAGVCDITTGQCSNPTILLFFVNKLNKSYCF